MQSTWPFERRTKLLSNDAESAIFGRAISRKGVALTSLNLQGSSLMGMTPKYKRQLISRYLLDTKPDVIFVQDAFDQDQMNELIQMAVPNNDYSMHIRQGSVEEEGEKGAAAGLASSSIPMNMSSMALAWNTAKFEGKVLMPNDIRLKEFGEWMKQHDIVVVQLRSKEKVHFEDVYPSFVAIAWLGPDYSHSQSERTEVASSFLRGLRRLRSKKFRVPIVVGGDFRLDMADYEEVLSVSEFGLVSFATPSSLAARDMRNTFVFTMDSLMVQEKAIRQYHPNTFDTPFVSVVVMARHRLRLWAVVRIQRAIRKWLSRARYVRDTRQRIRDKQKVWKIRQGIKDDNKQKDGNEHKKGQKREKKREREVGSDVGRGENTRRRAERRNDDVSRKSEKKQRSKSRVSEKHGKKSEQTK